MKTFFLILCLIFSTAISFSQADDYSRTLFEKSDKQLNETYQKLLFIKQSDTVFIKNLKASQRIWIQFRDAQLKLKYPDHASFEKKGPIPIREAMYLVQLTDERTKELLERLKTSMSELEDDVRYSRNDSLKVYVSDLTIIYSADLAGGVGIDRPYWTDELILCGKKYKKGIIMHPKNGGTIGFAEFRLPKKGGRLVGLAGWAEATGATSRGKMRFRIFVDGELLYGRELIGMECQRIDLDLGPAKVLRIETDDGGDGYYSDHMAFGDLRILY